MTRRLGLFALVFSLTLGVPTFAPQAVAQPSADTNVRQPIPDFVAVAEKVLPQVINLTIEPIGSKTSTDDREMNEELLRYLLENQPGDFWSRTVTGSGVVIKKEDGRAYAITNNHVVRPLNRASQLKVTFHREDEDGIRRSTEIVGDNVRVVGTDQLSDIAVVEFEIPEGFIVEPVPFADSDDVKIGQWVMALGSPLDFQNSISQGVISNKQQFLNSGISIEGLLQTDATIQPGNSGGPLVNLNGEIIGIVNAIQSSTGYFQGVGFAIPANSASKIANQIIDRGRVARGYLGVTMQTLRQSPSTAVEYGLGERPFGVLIERVVRNSPADVAGLRRRDVIVSIDGVPIKDNEEMLRTIANQNASETIAMEVIRLDEAKEPETILVEATLTERPDEQVLQLLHDDDQNFFIPLVPEEGEEVTLGLELEPRRGVGNLAGLEVTAIEQGSTGSLGELAVGDLILTVNSRRVRTLSDFQAALTHPVNGRHMFSFIRSGDIVHAELPAD